MAQVGGNGEVKITSPDRQGGGEVEDSSQKYRKEKRKGSVRREKMRGVNEKEKKKKDEFA